LAGFIDARHLRHCRRLLGQIRLNRFPFFRRARGLLRVQPERRSGLRVQLREVIAQPCRLPVQFCQPALEPLPGANAAASYPLQLLGDVLV